MILWTDDKVAALRRYADDGLTRKQMAFKFGCPRGAVDGKCRRLGIKALRWTKWSPERKARLGHLVAAGCRNKEIAADPLIASPAYNVYRQAERFGFHRPHTLFAKLRLPEEAIAYYKAAAKRRKVSQAVLLRNLLLEIASCPWLLDNVLDDGVVSEAAE